MIVKEGVYTPVRTDKNMPIIVVVRVDRMYNMVTWRWIDETQEREISRMNFEANLPGHYRYDVDATVRLLDAKA